MYTYAQIQMSERQNFCTKAKLNFFPLPLAVPAHTFNYNMSHHFTT